MSHFTLLRRSLSRSYGSNLPNSLTKVLPIPLVYSTRPPVSVCGTVTRTSTLRGFSRQYGLSHLWPLRAPPTPQDQVAGFTWHPHLPTGLAPQSNKRLTYPPASPHRSTPGGTGILTCCPSPTPFGLGLGPTNPTRINLPSETSDLRGTWFSHVLRYSCRHSHFCSLHHVLTVVASMLTERSPTKSHIRGKSVASVTGLSPGIFSAQNH